MKRLVCLAAAGLFAAGAIVPTAAHAAPSGCRAAFTKQMSVIEKSVGDAYEAFNMGEAAKTKPLMAKAIAAAKKALKGAPTKEKSLLKALIAIGPDQYRVSMMKDAVMALQDYQLRGCSA